MNDIQEVISYMSNTAGRVELIAKWDCVACISVDVKQRIAVC